MINLNRKMVDKQSLLKYITDLEVYQKYIDEEIIPNKPILSPLRNENNPSFVLFQGETGEICFKDFTSSLSGDCVKFVQLKFNLTFFEALSKIAIDFNMEDDFIVKKMEKTITNNIQVIDRNEFLSKATTFDLKKTSRKWQSHDLLYWQTYGISLKTLEKFNVEPIEYFHINNKIIKADKYAYCFIEFKDGKETYKIYQPYNEKYKWLNSHNNTVWQGWSQLPNKSDVLIITKSLKDVMAIYEVTELPAVALQCENVLPKKHVFEILENRFNVIYGFYDNDFDKEENWGRIFGKKLCSEYNLINIEIDDKYQCKDFSDLIKKVGTIEAKKILTEEMIIPF